MASLYTVCLSGSIKCKASNQCVPSGARCNGQSECLDGSDESGCDTIYPGTESDFISFQLLMQNDNFFSFISSTNFGSNNFNYCRDFVLYFILKFILRGIRKWSIITSVPSLLGINSSIFAPLAMIEL